MFFYFIQNFDFLDCFWAKNGPKCQKTLSFALYILKWQNIMSVTLHTWVSIHHLIVFFVAQVQNDDISWCFSDFELTYRDSGNSIHFSIFLIQIFPSSQNIAIPKYNKVSYSKTEKQEFLSAAVKKQISRFFEWFVSIILWSFSSQLISTKLVIFI